MDLSRAINVLISSATEIAGTMPRAPYIMFAGQDEGFEEMWDDAPVKNYTRLYINPIDLNGSPAPFPQRQQTEPQIQGLLLLLRMMHEMYHAVTGSVSPQIRAVNPQDRSGKAIEALQRQGAAGTSNYLDNLATISMLYEGMCLIDAIPHYYDTPGRILRVMGEENDDETAIMLKVPFTRDADGAPVPVPCPTCQGSGTQMPTGMFDPALRVFGMGGQPTTCPACQGSTWATKANAPKEWDEQPVEYVDFAEGQYKVVAAVDRAFATKQEEALAGMMQLAQASPEMVPMYADLWVRAMGFSGANEIADRIKAQNPSLQAPEDMKNIPPAVQAKFQALAQEHEQAMEALQQAQKMLETDAIKTAGQKEIATIRAAVSEKLERIKADGRMLDKKVSGQMSAELETLRGQIQGMQQEAEHRHEILLTLLKEQGAKEVERHSVELHDAAAAAAAERAGLSAIVEADREDSRTATEAQREDLRAERQASREDTRTVMQADREDSRAETQAQRDERARHEEAEREDARLAAEDRAKASGGGPV